MIFFASENTNGNVLQVLVMLFGRTELAIFGSQ